jgi:hypothetical protein
MKFYEQIDVLVLVITTTLFIFLLNYEDIFDPAFRDYDYVTEPGCTTSVDSLPDPDDVVPNDMNKTQKLEWAYGESLDVREFKDDLCRATTNTLIVFGFSVSMLGERLKVLQLQSSTPPSLLPLSPPASPPPPATTCLLIPSFPFLSRLPTLHVLDQGQHGS